MRTSVDGASASRYPSLRLLRGLFVVLAMLQSASSAAQDASSQDQSQSTGLDVFRPPANMFQLMYQYKTAPGSEGVVTTNQLNLRFDHSMDLAPMWILAFRSDLPLLAKNPDGDYLYGVGDADIQAALIRNLNERWAVGFGARLIAPTGGDTLGSGKWQIMPIVGARYQLSEINSASYLEPIVRYAVSFAGDPSKKNISNLQIGPTFNLGLPDRWFITFYPSEDIRVNFGDPVTGQTGRLFLPFDVRVGRKLSNNVVVSLEIGVPIIKDYPVYNFKSEVRLNMKF